MRATYKVFHEESMGPDEFKEIEAFDREQAAEKYAEDYDCEGDYTVIGGTNILVEVEGPVGEPDSKREVFLVSGESIPSYNASDTSCSDCQSTTKLRRVTRRHKKYGHVWVEDTVCHSCFKNIKDTLG